MTNDAALTQIKSKIRDVENFPKPGITFRDITPLLADGELFKKTVDLFVARYAKQSIQQIVGIDARGFILGAALAYELSCGFVPVRKSGKLPAKTLRQDYDLEYGSSSLELHADSFQVSQRIVIIDDLLATGGTASAAANLVRRAGAEVVEVAFLIELLGLGGRDKLAGFPIFSAISYA